MLAPHECLAGPIDHAQEMSLILPRSRYEHLALIVVSEGKMHSVHLGGDMKPFMSFACDRDNAWAGLHIPGVAIELDETSLTDAEGFYAPLGSMVRHDDKLSVSVTAEARFAPSAARLPILTGLPPCAEQSAACFLSWRIVLGEGENKRVLHTVDVRKDNSTA